jgi:hypothetical protein
VPPEETETGFFGYVDFTWNYMTGFFVASSMSGNLTDDERIEWGVWYFFQFAEMKKRVEGVRLQPRD